MSDQQMPTNTISVENALATSLSTCVNLNPICDNSLLKKEEIQLGIYNKLKMVLGFQELIDRIKNNIYTYPYFCVVDGLNFDKYYNLLIGISNIFGFVVEPYKRKDYDIIQIIRPSTDYLGSDKPLVEDLHTDGTSFLNPNDVTLLLCKYSDQNGEGKSVILPIDSLINCIVKLKGEAFLNELEGKNIPWKLSESKDEDIFCEPILSQNGLRWMKYTITNALMKNNHLDPEGEIACLVEEFDAFINSAEVSRSLHTLGIKRGQLLIFNNRKMLHGRTEINNPEMSNRTMVRARTNKQTGDCLDA